MRAYRPKIKVAYLDEDKLYFIPFDVGAIFVMDLKSEITTYLAMLPLERYVYSSLGAMVKNKNKILIAPGSMNQILVYDLEKNTFEKIKYESGANIKFGKGFVKDDFVYFIGRDECVIIKVNTLNNEIKILNKFQSEINEDIGSGIWSRGSNARSKDGSSVLVVNTQNSCVLEQNLNNDDYKIHKLKTNEKGFGDIQCMNGAYYLFPRNGSSIIKWDFQSTVSEFDDKIHLNGYMHTFCSENEIIIIDANNLKGYRIDVVEKKIKDLNFNDQLSFTSDQSDKMKVRWLESDNDKIYMSLMYVAELCVYDIKQDTVRTISFLLSEESKRQYLLELGEKTSCYTEKMPFIMLSDILSGYEKERGRKKNIGKAIYMQNIE